MAFQSGVTNDLAGLISAIQVFCTSNGWTLSGNVLHKNGCFTRLTVDGNTVAALGGTGIDGSNNLTVPGPGTVHLAAPLTVSPITYPATYFLHAMDNEVYAILRWGGDMYAYIGFGISPVVGLPGTGGWYASNMWEKNSDTGITTFGRNGYYGGYADRYNNGQSAVGWFYTTGRSQNSSGGYVHHGLDGATWSGYGNNGTSGPSTDARCNFIAGPLLILQPNQWNGDSVLIPVQPAIARPESKISIIADLKHLRLICVLNIAVETVITLGPDKWKVYPFYRKGAAMNPSNTDSGGLGFAVRYDGV